MIAVSLESEARFLNSLVGQTLCVLFETVEDGYWVGYTPNYAKVTVKSDENLNGKLLNVKILSAKKEHCEGEIV